MKNIQSNQFGKDKPNQKPGQTTGKKENGANGQFTKKGNTGNTETDPEEMEEETKLAEAKNKKTEEKAGKR